MMQPPLGGSLSPKWNGFKAAAQDSRGLFAEGEPHFSSVDWKNA